MARMRILVNHAYRRGDSGMKRRRIDIVADILDVAVKGAKKTRIMQNANLSYSLLMKYLEYTLGIGFLQPDDGSYETTEKGRKFLEMYARFSSEYSKLQKDLEPLWLKLESLEKMCSPPAAIGCLDRTIEPDLGTTEECSKQKIGALGKCFSQR